MKSTIYPWDHRQSQAGRAAWPDGKQPGTAARTEPFLRVASALFSTPHISEGKWCTSQSQNYLYLQNLYSISQ